MVAELLPEFGKEVLTGLTLEESLRNEQHICVLGAEPDVCADVGRGKS